MIYDELAERQVLGAMLAWPHAIDEILAILDADDFYLHGHRDLFRRLAAARAAGDPTDVAAMARGERERSLYFADLARDATTPQAAVGHARRVADCAFRRRLVERAHALIEAANSSEDYREALEALVSCSAETRTDAADLGEHVARVVDDVEAAARGLLPAAVGTGIRPLDAICGGLYPGQLVVLAARPGVGKSALALQIATAAAGAGTSVLFLSLEMSGWEVAARSLAAATGISWPAIRRGDVGDWSAVVSAGERLSELPLHVCDRPDLGVVELGALARRYQAGLVVVDYLQLLSTRGLAARQDRRDLEIGAQTRALKMLAKQLLAPVLVLSQLSREPERTQREPRLADLRDSGAIEQDADMVFFLHRADESPAEQAVKLIVAKNRNGPAGRHLMLQFRPRTMIFSAQCGLE